MCFRSYNHPIISSYMQSFACNSSNYSTHDWATVSSSNRNVGKWANQMLIEKLGDGWTEEGGMVVPKKEARLENEKKQILIEG